MAYSKLKPKFSSSELFKYEKEYFVNKIFFTQSVFWKLCPYSVYALSTEFGLLLYEVLCQWSIPDNTV